MSGHQISVSRDVLAPPEAVWAVLTDLDAAPDTMRGIVSVERVSGPEGYAVGTRWRETRRMFGKAETQELYVTEVDPPRSTTVEADHAGVHYTTRFVLTPKGTGTDLSFEFAAHHPDPTFLQRATWQVLGRVGGEVTKRMCRQDLADIARAAEARSETEEGAPPESGS